MPNEPLHPIQIAIARTGLSQHVIRVLSLRHYLPSDTRIIAGGRAAGAYRATLEGIGAAVVSSLDECCQTLERIRSERLAATTAPRP